MSSVFHKITEEEIFDLMSSEDKLESNIIISDIDEDLMERIISELKKYESLNNGTYLIDMTSVEIDHIVYLTWLIPFICLHAKMKKAKNSNLNESSENELSEIEKLENKKKEIEVKEIELRLAEHETCKARSMARERKSIIRNLHSELYNSLFNLFDGENREALMNRILEQEQLSKSDKFRIEECEQEEKRLKFALKDLKSQLKILEILMDSQKSVLTSYIVEAYFIGKLLRRFSSNSEFFKMLNVAEYAVKSKNYENLIDPKVFDIDPIIKSLFKGEAFSWQKDIIIPFCRAKGMRVVNWIPNFQNFQSIKSHPLAENMYNIINKSSSAMKFIILTSFSTKETHELFASFEDPGYSNPKDPITGYKEFSLTRAPRKPRGNNETK